MALTLGDIRANVRAQLDIDDTDLPNSLLDSYVKNVWYRVVASENAWPFLVGRSTFNTVAGQADYTYAQLSATDTISDVIKIRTPRIEVRFISDTQAEQAWQLNSTQRSEPVFWTQKDFGTVTLWPTPDTIYSCVVRYIKSPFDFVAAGTSATPTDLPDAFHYLIQQGTLWYAYMQQDDPEMAAQHKQMFDEQYMTLRKKYTSNPQAQPVVLNDVPSRRGNLPGRLPYPFDR